MPKIGPKKYTPQIKHYRYLLKSMMDHLQGLIEADAWENGYEGPRTTYRSRRLVREAEYMLEGKVLDE